MGVTAKRITITAMTILVAIITIMATLLPVIARECTGIQQKSEIYKAINLCIFPTAFYVLAWRRHSLPGAVLVPLIQILSVNACVLYLRSLPMTCP